MATHEEQLQAAEAHSGTVEFLEALADALPEQITLADVKARPWLGRLICVVARIEGMSTYEAYCHAKEQAS